MEVSLKGSQERDKGGAAATQKAMVLHMSAQNRVTKRLYTGQMSHSGLQQHGVHRTISAAQKLLVAALRGTSDAVMLEAGYPEVNSETRSSPVGLTISLCLLLHVSH